MSTNYFAGHNSGRLIVDRIRASKKFGEGTCSVIDECYSDEELVAQFGFNWDGKALSVKDAVASARDTHASWADGMADAENSGWW